MKFYLDSPVGVASTSIMFIFCVWMVGKTNSLSALTYPLLMGAVVGIFSFLLHESLSILNRYSVPSLRLKIFQSLMTIGFSLIVMAPYMTEKLLSSTSLTWQDFMVQWGGHMVVTLEMSAITFVILNLKQKFFQSLAQQPVLPQVSATESKPEAVSQGREASISQASVAEQGPEVFFQRPVVPISQASVVEPKPCVFFPPVFSSTEASFHITFDAASQSMSQDNMDGASNLDLETSSYSVLSC